MTTTSASSSWRDLVEEHLPLIGYHVNELMARVPQHVSRDDLSSAGALALVKAAQAYDPATGVPFPRYAAIRVRGALVDELRSMDWASRGTRTRVRRVAAVVDELTASLGHAPSREQIAEALGVDVAEVDQARDDAQRRVLSIDGFGGGLGEVLPDHEPAPEAQVLDAEKLRYLHAAVAQLPERLQLVVRLVYFEDRTVTDVAAELGVTQSRVSQLRAEATSLLRDALNTHLDPEQVPAAANPTGVAQRRRQAYFDAVGEAAAPKTVVPAPVVGGMAAGGAGATTPVTPAPIAPAFAARAAAAAAVHGSGAARALRTAHRAEHREDVLGALSALA